MFKALRIFVKFFVGLATLRLQKQRANLLACDNVGQWQLITLASMYAWLFYMLFILSIIAYYNTFTLLIQHSQDYDLVSHTTYVVYVNLIHQWQHL